MSVMSIDWYMNVHCSLTGLSATCIQCQVYPLPKVQQGLSPVHRKVCLLSTHSSIHCPLVLKALSTVHCPLTELLSVYLVIRYPLGRSDSSLSLIHHGLLVNSCLLLYGLVLSSAKFFPHLILNPFICRFPI